MKPRLFTIIIVLMFIGSVFLFGQTPVIWVFDNNDSDYTTPPFEDTLTCLALDGTVIWSISQFNTAQAIGDNTKVVADSVTGCWLVEIAGDRLYKLDSDGLVVVNESVPDAISLAISDDGQNVYVAKGSTINDTDIDRYSNSGTLLSTTSSAGGFDIAYSPFDDTVVGVNKGIYKVSSDLSTLQYGDAAEYGWSAVSVDTWHTDGTIWVAEREYSSSSGANNVRIYNASWTLLRTISTGSAPWTVAVKQSDGSCYIGTASNTLHFDAAGDLIETLPTSAFSIAIDNQENVWLASRTSTSIYKYSPTGSLLWTSPAIFSSDQKGIAFGYIDGTPPANTPPSAANLSVDGKTGNPNNVSTFSPEFSWTFQDADSGDSQSAYQIQVGTTAGASNLWDYTGTFASSVVYSGDDIPANVTVYWRARVEDQGPDTSSWAQGTFVILDIGLRAYDGTEIIKVAVDSDTSVSKLRIHKDGTTYAIILVDQSDTNASKLKIETSLGVRSLKKM